MLELYTHPISSYGWKAMIALHERGLDYTLRPLGADHADNGAAFARRWPLAKMPLLVDGDRAVAESSVVVEYLDGLGEAPPLVPAPGDAALRVRFLDRVFDSYVSTPMQRIIADLIRPSDDRDPTGVTAARALLERCYDWLESELGEPWATGETFTLADCAAAPALYYGECVGPFRASHPRLAAYFARLLARPSFRRCIDGARPLLGMFPGTIPHDLC